MPPPQRGGGHNYGNYCTDSEAETIRSAFLRCNLTLQAQLPASRAEQQQQGRAGQQQQRAANSVSWWPYQMHSFLVSSVRIFWNRCRELSDKERVHELKVNCHCIVAYDTNVDTDTFSFPHTRSIRRMSFCCMKNIESIIAFRGTPQCKIAKYQMGGKRRLPQANPVHQCRYLLLLGTPSELKTVLSGKNSHVGRPPPLPQYGNFFDEIPFFF